MSKKQTLTAPKPRLEDIRFEAKKRKQRTDKILKEETVKMTGDQKRSFLKKSLKFAGKHKVYMIFSLVFMVIGNLLDLLVPVFIGKCIDLIIAPGMVDFSQILHWLIIMGISLVVNLIFTWLYNLFTNIYVYKTSAYLRGNIFAKFNRVPLNFIDRSTLGDLLNRMVNDVEILTDGMVEAVITVTSGVVTIVGTLVFMLVLNVQMAMIIAIITPLSLFFAYSIARRANLLFTAQAKKTGELNGYLEELISNQQVVKAFNREDESVEKFDGINEGLANVAEKAVFYSSLAPPFTRLINGIVYVAVGLFGSLMALRGYMSVGLISSFLSYAGSYGRPFNELANEITEIQAAYASANRIFEILEEPDEVSDEGNLELAFVDGSVSIEKAYFSYTPKVKLIQDFNLEVEPGQKVAIVGPTGCGKSTLINLLMRFYDLNSGSIKVSGNDITRITRRSLRLKYGMVLQESWLFHGTIRDNISYGNQNATIEEVIEAAKMAGAHEFIEKLPEKYDTLITEGGNNISQGEKQLLCIARIMLLKPPMLILDEATSNIDTRAELKIQEAFNNIMEGRTSFVIAHRLSTIKDADVILVMNKGNVIEKGRHQELLAQKGFYYNLYNSQFAKDE